LVRPQELVTPRVWLAEHRDAETVARLLVDFRNHLGLGWPSDNAFLAGVERLLDDRDSEFMLGSPHDDAPPGGVIQLRYRFGIWRAGFDCLVEDLFVVQDARSSGLGHALVEGAIARARERGCRRMELDTNEANDAARALYEGFGFVNDRGAGRDLYYRLHLDAGPDA
jgi:GNAT superfamily N-acetyltransferase